jgi:hypothetical protein
MASYKRTESKLLRSGFVPQEQNHRYECWISTRGPGTISFYKEENEISGFKVHSSVPDRPECDEFNSYYTNSLSRAIEMCKVIG